MAEYSRLASGTVLSALTGAPTSVILPFVPNFIEISNATRALAVTGVTRAWWETDMGQGAAFLETTSAGPVTGTSFVTAGGFSTFQAGLALQFGAVQLITAMTAASPSVVTSTSPHGLVTGNVVVFQNLYETTTTGLQQIAGMPFVVTVVDATHFSINWNASGGNFTAITASGVNAPSFKQVLYPNLYAPNVGFVSALTLAATTTVTTTAPTNFQVGQEVAFRVPPQWGTTQLNSLPDVLIPGSPIYGYVTAVNSNVQFVVNINSTGYTAFNPNPTFASYVGSSFPQVVAVGDNNSGSNQFGYNSPAFYNGQGPGTVRTINGPAVAGAFCNNTSMGFVIGSAVAGTTADVLYWRAYMHDLNT